MRTKPRDYFNCKATDKLILFDYLTDMDERIDRELNLLDNQVEFKTNENRTYTDEFLDDAENLFRERGCLDKRTLTLIGSLRGKVKTFDSWRVFMETLLLVTMTFRNGDIPEIAQSGAIHIQKVVGGGKDGGSKSGKVRREKAAPTKEAQQALADEIWRKPKNSKLSKSSVAELVKKKIGGNVRTIRGSIQKPLP